ncbi:MAG: diguanylate cyclase, partial [Alkalispirochaetaceae bacterium]
MKPRPFLTSARYLEILSVLANYRFGEVLRHVAECLTRTTRIEDVVARYGGEEFVVLTPTVPIQGAACLAERLRRAVEGMLVRYAKHTLRVTLSL